MAVCTTPEASQRQMAVVSGGGLLDPADEMVLRVRCGREEPQVVRIRSAKCTVGSAAGCTLRLRGANVDRLACWILRGRSASIIRRLHGSAALNGAPIDEAPLKRGDRLKLGAVELEIVECNQPAEPTESPFPPPAVDVTQIAAVQDKLDEALAEIDRLHEESRQAFQSSITAAERADQLRDAMALANEELEELHGALAAAEETVAKKSAECEEFETRLAAERTAASELTSLLKQVRDEAAVAAAQHEQLEGKLREVSSAINQERERWSAERSELDQRIASQEAEIETLRASAAAAASCAVTIDFAQARKLEETAKTELQSRIEELEQQLAAGASEIQSLQRLVDAHAGMQQQMELLATNYETKCRELEGVQARLAAAESVDSEAKVDIQQQQEALAKWQAELADQQAALNHAEKGIEQQRLQLATEMEQLTATQEQVQQLDARQREIDRQAAELSAQLSEMEARQGQLDELQGQFSEQQNLIARQSQEIVAWREELEGRQRQIDTLAQDVDARERELAESQRPFAQSASVPISADATDDEMSYRQTQPGWQPDCAEHGRQEEMTESSPIDEDTAANKADGPNPHDSAQMNSVLSRLVTAGLWREEGPADDSAAPHAYPPGGEQASQEKVRLAPAESPAWQPRTPSAAPEPHVASDEESIESYMERLMQRVRGDSSGARTSATIPSPTVAPPAVEVRPAVDVSPAAPVAVGNSSSLEPDNAEAAPTLPDEPDLSRRRPAPDLGANLSALRDIANSAARSAIDQHVRKHTGKQATSRLIGACLTLTSSTVLGYFAWQENAAPATAGAIIGGALGVYWMLAAIRRFFKLFRLNRPKAESL